METPQIDLTAGLVQKAPPAGAAPAQGGIDLSAGLVSHSDAGTQPANPYPINEGDKGAVAQVAKTGNSILSLPKNLWHAFTGEPQDDLEKASVAALSKMPMPGGITPMTPTMALGLHRLIIAPLMKSNEIADAYQKIADAKKAAAGKPKEESLVSELTGGLIRPEGRPAPGREWDSNKSLPRNLWNFVFSGNADDNGEYEQHMANVHRIASLTPLAGSSASDIVEHYKQGDQSGAAAQLLTLLAAGKATDSLTKGLGKQVSKVAPKTATIAGEEVPVMAGQVKDAAPIAKEVAAEPSAKIAEQQQSAAQKGVKNVASDALNRQLSKVGREAAPEHAQLPAGPNEPFVFTIKGDLPEEVITGKSTVPAKRIYAGTEKVPIENAPAAGEPNYVRQRGELGTTADTIPDSVRGSRTAAQARAQEIGSAAPTVPDRLINGPDSTESIKWHYLTSGTEAGESVSTRGAGTLHTADPVAATETLKALKSHADQTPAVKEAITSLEDQLQQYHAYDGQKPPSSPAIPKSGQASSFGDAAAQTKAAAQPTFKKLDQLSDGEFSAFQNKLKMATQAERRATTMKDMETAQQAQQEARKGIDDLMTKHSDQFQPNELSNAQSAWKDAQVLDNVHGYVEKAFSAPESVAATSNLVSRTLNGNKLITNLNQMVDKIPAEDLQRVLGPDGLNNLYELGQITSKPEAAASLNTVVQQVANKLAKSGTGAAIGAGVAGKPGAMVGAVADVGKDAVIRAISTNPRVAALTVKALKFATPAKVYGPLIANEIQKAQGDEQQQ